MRLVEEAAASNFASVSIVGESGTGKKLVARTIHELSARRGGPYVAVSCAGLPDDLMESELWGHERGAFAGADRRREGFLAMANGGTLLLDEITDLKIELQAKLLRTIEDKKLQRIGSVNESEIPLDVRLIAASSKKSYRGHALRPDCARIYFPVSILSPSSCRRCATGSKIFPRWSKHLLRSRRRRIENR